MKARLLAAVEFIIDHLLLLSSTWLLWQIATGCIKEDGFSGAIAASLPMALVAVVLCAEDWWGESFGTVIGFTGLCVWYAMQVSVWYWFCGWLAPHLGFEAEFGWWVGLGAFILRHEIEDFVVWRRERREGKNETDDTAA